MRVDQVVRSDSFQPIVDSETDEIFVENRLTDNTYCGESPQESLTYKYRRGIDLFDKNIYCSNLLRNLFISEPEGDLFEKCNSGCNLLRDLFSETNNNDLLDSTSSGCNVLKSLFTGLSSGFDWLETTSEFSVLDFLFISKKPVCSSDDNQKLVQQRPSMISKAVLVAGDACKVSFVGIIYYNFL